MPRKRPSQEELLALVPRVHPKYKPVWEGRSAKDQAALAGYFLRRRSKKEYLTPERPDVITWYCPFAAQDVFPSGHRYCINVYVACANFCSYCYALAYQPDVPGIKQKFRSLLDKDMALLDEFDVPAAPVHLSNSTDPFQDFEREAGDTKYALERILAHRHRFTTVTLLTKNPGLPVANGYLDLFKQLMKLPQDHPRFDEFQANGHPAFQVQVSLAFRQEAAREAYDRCAPTVQERIDAIRALHEAGIPIIMRIDPLFLRSPLPTRPVKTLDDFDLVEAQTLEDLDSLVQLAAEVQVRHVVYSPLRVVQNRRRTLSKTMNKYRLLYEALAEPGTSAWRNRSCRLSKEIARRHVVEPFLEICAKRDVRAKFCMQDLVETI